MRPQPLTGTEAPLYRCQCKQEQKQEALYAISLFFILSQEAGCPRRKMRTWRGRWGGVLLWIALESGVTVSFFKCRAAHHNFVCANSSICHLGNSFHAQNRQKMNLVISEVDSVFPLSWEVFLFLPLVLLFLSHLNTLSNSLKSVLPSPLHPCAFDVWLTCSVHFSQALASV